MFIEKPTPSAVITVKPTGKGAKATLKINAFGTTPEAVAAVVKSALEAEANKAQASARA